MCGIAGVFSPTGFDIGDLVGMTSVIRHRGPDDEGYVLLDGEEALCLGGKDTPDSSFGDRVDWLPKQQFSARANTHRARVGFGHRRLSIVDLSPLGHQPMSYLEGRYWITYNGEIYNHIELRQELASFGHRFYSHSDTEVILAAYHQWGRECLHRFNGMWAFAIFDRCNQELFLARDRFGVKPLYYWVSPDGSFCFGSEIKQFVSYPGWRACVNPQRAYDFLAWGISDHTDETLFDGVFQFRPGFCLTLETGSFRAQPGGRLPVDQWYQLSAAPFSGTFDEAALQFRDMFSESVALRLRADVSVGSCLSGGLDSSSIVCVMNGLLTPQGVGALQKTFSACAEDTRFDERRWVDEVVQATGTEAHYCYPSAKDLFDSFPLITWHQDEPFGSTSIFAQWSVFQMAAQNDVKVMLDGQGADEQLAGYYTYFGPRFAALFRQGRWRRLWREVRLTKAIHGRSEKLALFGIADVLLPQSIRNHFRSLVGGPSSHPSWLDVGKLGASGVDPNSRLGGYADSIRSLSIAQMTATNLQMLLHWEDRNSMAHGVESRVPFLDYRLVEFVLGLPDEFKLAEGVTKRVQRRAMSGILPDKIRDRMDKLGFVTPEEVWVREECPDAFRLHLKRSVESASGVLTKHAFDNLEDIIAGRRRFDFSVWRMVSFGEWLKRFGISIL